MSEEKSPPLGLVRELGRWFHHVATRHGAMGALRRLLSAGIYFVRDSTPARPRARYGDIDFDWDHRVDTTGATVGRRSRLRGALGGSLYQPSEPALFHQIMASLPIDFSQFTFLDMGSGKGRPLLMASDYCFRRIVGVELLQLHRIAQENVRKYSSDRQRCHAFELHCIDAAEYEFPPEPLLLYLFNPLHEEGLERVLDRLQRSLAEHPRPVIVVYPNPLLEPLVAERDWPQRIGGTHQCAIYKNRRCA